MRTQPRPASAISYGLRRPLRIGARIRQWQLLPGGPAGAGGLTCTVPAPGSWTAALGRNRHGMMEGRSKSRITSHNKRSAAAREIALGVVLVDQDGVLADFEQGLLDAFRASHPGAPFIA